MDKLTREFLNTLPANAIADLKSTLGAFSKAHVWKKGEEYKVVAHIALSAGDNEWNYIDTFTSSEIFTPSERILNYVRNFRDFPFRAGKDHLTYKGEKDYKAIRSDWTEVTLNENGDLAFS
tara:strand:- start:203 stop:565 length:363 start_codon:yes stop_codon:yes gene_type:complete